MAQQLRTNRLLLEPLTQSDAEQVQLIFPQWEVVKFLNASVPWPFPPDGVSTYYCEILLPAVARGEEWHWTIRLKSAPAEVIGSVGLNRGESINRGFWLAPLWHNKGLMTEAVIATNDYWFDVLGFEVLRAPKAISNVASRRISEKTGMRVIAVEEHDYVSGRLQTEIWEITDQEWRRKRESMLRE